MDSKMKPPSLGLSSSLGGGLKPQTGGFSTFEKQEENQSIPTIPYVKLSNQIASVLQFCDKDRPVLLNNLLAALTRCLILWKILCASHLPYPNTIKNNFSSLPLFMFHDVY